jgi:hypothetical protein
MKIDDVHHLENMINLWDGEIVIDAYEIEPPEGYAIISLTRNKEIVYAINFKGTQEDMLFLFTKILRKNMEKVVEEQREDIKKFHGL